VRPPACPAIPVEIVQLLWAGFVLLCIVVLDVILFRRRK
jgi:hypothetical protein